MGITVFMWWLFIFVLAHTFWKKWPDRAFPTIIISITTVFCIVWIAVGSLILTGVVPDYSVVTLWDFIRSGILALVFEFLLVALVWPIYLNNRKAGKDPTSPPPDHTPIPELKPAENYTVQIGDITVDTRSLLTIQAQQHYVQLSCINRNGMTRLSISKAIAQLDGVDGIQVHRSWWVARQAAKQLKREDGKQVLELNTGELIPVSRGRSGARLDEQHST
ncbi:LytTR family DNA-binding domain-containing protein [Thalassobius sp. I31.1]|uniref:LytTR family DNA-binding domain-containing protein n=1 Tax=Thalassobius sp. I31.1 TaxID=2109912 RepID=UPI0018E57E76|nr:LytTR family DNA-binding domain-containing protein [Thalassobius sp. I31.1]